MILGLTVRQPWAWLIAAGFKDVENRTWRAPKKLIGRQIAIHAGLRDEDHEVFAAVKRLHGIRVYEGDLHRGAIVAVAILADCVTEHPSPWFTGPFGWVLEHVLPVRPIPCRGQLGLWSLPATVERELEQRIEEPLWNPLAPAGVRSAPFPARAELEAAASRGRP